MGCVWEVVYFGYSMSGKWFIRWFRILKEVLFGFMMIFVLRVVSGIDVFFRVFFILVWFFRGWVFGSFFFGSILFRKIICCIVLSFVVWMKLFVSSKLVLLKEFWLRWVEGCMECIRYKV